MENNKNLKMLRSFRFYMPQAMKFYNLKKEYLTPLTFILALILYSVGALLLSSFLTKSNIDLNEIASYLSTRNMDLADLQSFLSDMYAFYGTNLLINFVRDTALGIVSAMFLFAFIKELKAETYTLKSSLVIVLKKTPVIIFASIVFTLGYTLGLQFLIIPGAIVYCVFLFNLCFVLDGDQGLISAFQSSMILTKGNRMQLFSILFFFKLSTFLLLSFLVSLFNSSNNNLLIMIVNAFLSAVVYLMETKLLASMYVDLVYGWKAIIVEK